MSKKLENIPENRDISPPRGPSQQEKGRKIIEFACEKNSIEKIKLLEKWFREKYAITTKRVEKKEVSGDMSIFPMDLCDYAKSLAALKIQIIKIPPVLFRRLDINQFLLGKIISREERDGKVIEKEVAGSHGWGDTIALNESYALFHELFHRIDDLNKSAEFGGGIMNVKMLPAHQAANRKNIEEWAKLDPNLQYEIITNSKGEIVRYYAGDEKGYFEDGHFDEEQAQYCRILFHMSNPYNEFEPEIARYEITLRQQLTSTEVGRKKLVKMKEWLYKFSDGLFDEQFWLDLEGGKVNSKYWDKRLKNKKAN